MKTLITGMQKGELIPPFNKKFNRRQLKGFFRYYYSLDKNNLIECGNDKDAEERLIQLKSESQIEIIGSYTENCVAISVCNALSRGMTIFSHHKYLFNRPSNPFAKIYTDKSRIEKGVIMYLDKHAKNLENYDYSFENGIHIFKPIF